MDSLQIPNDIFERMIAQAKAEVPIEACGILAGSDDGKVKKLYEMTNSDSSSTHFMMVPAEQFEVARDIRSARLDMLAVYHSHPGSPARPSAEDIRFALTPDVVYVIVSIQDSDNPVIKAFSISDGNVEESPVKISEDNDE